MEQINVMKRKQDFKKKINIVNQTNDGNYKQL